MNKETLVQKVISEINNCAYIEQLSTALTLSRLIINSNELTNADKSSIYNAITDKQEEILKRTSAYHASVARQLEISVELDIKN